MKRLASVLAVALVITSGAVTRADESADLVVARNWLAAAARGGAALEPTTTFPFTYRTTHKIKRCERMVRDASAFTKWAACFEKEQKLLLGEIRSGATLEGASARDVESKALRAIADRVPGEGRWLRAYINGDGVTFTFLFKVTGNGGTDRVSAMLFEADVENG
jgi:hypothetical protein